MTLRVVTFLLINIGVLSLEIIQNYDSNHHIICTTNHPCTDIQFEHDKITTNFYIECQDKYSCNNLTVTNNKNNILSSSLSSLSTINDNNKCSIHCNEPKSCNNINNLLSYCNCYGYCVHINKLNYKKRKLLSSDKEDGVLSNTPDWIC